MGTSTVHSVFVRDGTCHVENMEFFKKIYIYLYIEEGKLKFIFE